MFSENMLCGITTVMFKGHLQLRLCDKDLNERLVNCESSGFAKQN